MSREHLSVMNTRTPTQARVCAGYIRRMSGGGKAYSVYVYSYLGYGLMQGRGEVLSTSGSGACINEGTTGTFTSPYGGEEYPLQSDPGGADAERCAAAVRSALQLRKDCGAKVELCTFAGAWGGVASHTGRKFYVSSYFFDRCAARCMRCPATPCPAASQRFG